MLITSDLYYIFKVIVPINIITYCNNSHYALAFKSPDTYSIVWFLKHKFI